MQDLWDSEFLFFFRKKELYSLQTGIVVNLWKFRKVCDKFYCETAKLIHRAASLLNESNAKQLIAFSLVDRLKLSSVLSIFIPSNLLFVCVESLFLTSEVNSVKLGVSPVACVPKYSSIKVDHFNWNAAPELTGVNLKFTRLLINASCELLQWFCKWHTVFSRHKCYRCLTRLSVMRVGSPMTPRCQVNLDAFGYADLLFAISNQPCLSTTLVLNA